MPSGGPRTPANPAMVSGPGALSQRTDGGPGNDRQPIRVAPGGAYGDRQAAVAQQQAARVPQEGERPVVTTRDGRFFAGLASSHMDSTVGDQMSNAAYSGGALNAPSVRPGEPVTHGVGVGAGAGPEALTGAPAARQEPGSMERLLTQFAPGSATGAMAQLLKAAQAQGQ